MKKSSNYIYFIHVFSFMLFFLFTACNKEKKEAVLFEVLNSNKTGLNFSNNLIYNKEFNLFKYIYFYNGSGVGAGDFNNDGFIDLFFASNQSQNKIFLNNTNLTFKDVTKEANIPNDGGWSTGVSVVDINQDGLLDIYVCRVGHYEVLKGKNQLLINQGINKNGIPTFTDKASEYGLDFSGFSTQAAFFDYDKDGDLDMFLLNHSVHENGTFRPRNEFIGTYHPLSGDRFYRNDGNVYTDVTQQTGINSSAIGYGLGISIADINLDGYPDIYIGNDFHENDYLYINQKNGTFKEEGEGHLMHTSQFSMGVDVADVNNDAYPEIISMDMLPADPYILKRSLGEDAYDIFRFKIKSGYSYQYTRNNLQYNRKNGMFSETGLYSGIAATDWSWAPLWMDFNNDGLKDLFVSNGIPKRMNDIDYINFISDGEIQQKIRSNNIEGKDIALIDKFPEIKLPNKFYLNSGNLLFADQEKNIEGDLPTFSNGSVYADFDNDGDLDLVVNNIDNPAILYENKTSKKQDKNFLNIRLKGPEKNVNAIGAKVLIYCNQEIRTYEKFPVKGFLSAMETPLLIGLANTKVDSLLLIWPDNSYQSLSLNTSETSVNITYQKGLPLFNYSRFNSVYKTKKAIDITEEVNFNYVHQENDFSEFDREPLIPNKLSTEGPSLAVADINKDGLEDVFIGSARDYKSVIFLQQSSGKFIKSNQPALESDSIYEDTDACFSDVNNDGYVDLVIASGGNEFYGDDFHNTPRVYLNNGKAQFTKLENAFDKLYLTASCIEAADFNNDGFADMFIGARAVPFEYGKIPQSYLLMNLKNGKFKDVTSTLAADLMNIGFVTNSSWFDLDKDGDKDLLISTEWNGIFAFINNKGTFTKKVLTDKKGWWNFVLPYDINNDGNIDLICGNLGLNSRLKASDKEPVQLYYNDFDENEKKEQIVTYFLKGKEIPFANKAELEKQMPGLKKKFLYAQDFAKATLTELFTSEKLKNAVRQSADYFSNAILINKGNMQFETIAMPWEAQLTCYKAAVIVNADNNELPDILLMGNYYDNNIEMGRYDADFGTLLINKANGKFEVQSLNSLQIKGVVNNISPIKIAKYNAFIVALNSSKSKIIYFDK